MAKSLIQKLQDLEIITQGYFVLKSGEISDHYVDMRKAYGHPELLSEISNNLIEKIPSDATCIACSGLGGISLGTALSNKTNLSLTLVRDKPKDHGDLKIIEGYHPTPDDKIIIVDDVFSSGTSVKRTMENLAVSNLNVIKIIVILRRGINTLSCELDSLFTEEDLNSKL